jgi:hypothetical protein
VQNLNHEQAKEFLVELNQQVMMRENLYRDWHWFSLTKSYKAYSS